MDIELREREREYSVVLWMLLSLSLNTRHCHLIVCCETIWTTHIEQKTKLQYILKYLAGTFRAKPSD